MHTPPPTDKPLPDGDDTEITIPPTVLRHPPGHGLMDALDVAGHDEVQHEAALRDSALRPPR
ncbi:hypothetical protein [Dyella humicola]|uniref:hypothetical protein n=1 Tax=Dyella humicola TaxID=2992126 RepID=UPI00224FF092|nr:hypothetical protein [Dyella humicola]